MRRSPRDRARRAGAGGGRMSWGCQLCVALFALLGGWAPRTLPRAAHAGRALRQHGASQSPSALPGACSTPNTPCAVLMAWQPLSEALAASCPAGDPRPNEDETASQERCMVAAVGALMGSSGADVSVAMCAAHAAAVFELIDDCHLLAHAVGRAGYAAALANASAGYAANDTDAARDDAAGTAAALNALDRCDVEACVAGCVHGVIIEHLTAAKARFLMHARTGGAEVWDAAEADARAMAPLAGAVTALCHDTARPRGLTVYDCVHGGGHGLAAAYTTWGSSPDRASGGGAGAYRVNLGAARGACRAVGAALRIDSKMCENGAMMEHTMRTMPNALRVASAEAAKGWRAGPNSAVKEAMLAGCPSELRGDEGAARMCLSQLGETAMLQNGHDLALATQMCNTLGPDVDAGEACKRGALGERDLAGWTKTGGSGLNERCARMARENPGAVQRGAACVKGGVVCDPLIRVGHVPEPSDAVEAPTLAPAPVLAPASVPGPAGPKDMPWPFGSPSVEASPNGTLIHASPPPSEVSREGSKAQAAATPVNISEAEALPAGETGISSYWKDYHPWSRSRAREPDTAEGAAAVAKGTAAGAEVVNATAEEKPGVDHSATGERSTKAAATSPTESAPTESAETINLPPPPFARRTTAPEPRNAPHSTPPPLPPPELDTEASRTVGDGTNVTLFSRAGEVAKNTVSGVKRFAAAAGQAMALGYPGSRAGPGGASETGGKVWWGCMLGVVGMSCAAFMWQCARGAWGIDGRKGHMERIFVVFDTVRRAGGRHGNGGYVEMTQDGVRRPFSMPKPKLSKFNAKRVKGTEHNL